MWVYLPQMDKARVFTLLIIGNSNKKTFLFLRSVNPIDMVEEGDCFLCYPEDSTINTKQKNTHHRSSHPLSNRNQESKVEELSGK